MKQVQGSSLIKDRIILFYNAKDCFYIIGAIVWIKANVKIFSHTKEKIWVGLVWLVILVFDKNNRDFYQNLYSLESSDSRSYICMKMKKGITDLLLTKVNIFVPIIVLPVASV